MRDLKEHLKLYLILETSQLRLPLGDFIVQAVEGGVTAIQLRDKTETAADRYATAKALSVLLADKEVLFIINNTPDIALAVNAHGVHLGAEDLPPAAVRKAFPGLVTGYSCNNEADCALAISSQVDYAGVGPVFFTATKTNLRPVLGLDGLEATAGLLPIPKVAIGGINADNAAKLHNRGVDGIAVSSALCQSEVPYDMAVNLRRFAQSAE